MKRAVHICSFVGKPAPEGTPGPSGECDRSGCRKPAVRYAVFVWGAAQLCMKHYREDVTP